MIDLRTILANIEAEARREPFPIDKVVYERAQRKATTPILTAGSLRASLCMFARDLGHEEVLRGEPLVGSAGRRVRRAIFERMAPNAKPDPPLYQAALKHVLLTNTVPYKPVNNVEFDRATKTRFRPYIEQLLVLAWEGRNIIPMGEGAFKWFAPYAPPRDVVAFWDDRDRRFTETMDVTITAMMDGEPTEKTFTLAPVPHPSPRSPFMMEFPDLLEARLNQFLPRG